MKNTTDSYNEGELAEAIKKSDHLAFKTLYYRYFEALFRFLRRQVNDDELAKDLLQEAFCKFWKSRDKLDPRQSVKSYLYRISHNLVIDHRRKNLPATDTLDTHCNGELTYAADESFDFKDRTEKAIRELPEPVRLVFTMNRFDGIRYSEIAGTLNISVKTVEARMSKALTLLREKLAPFLASM
jgi:RNA polymerase sigma-70 factor (ECF subfamily)